MDGLLGNLANPHYLISKAFLRDGRDLYKVEALAIAQWHQAELLAWEEAANAVGFLLEDHVDASGCEHLKWRRLHNAANLLAISQHDSNPHNW